MKEFTIVTRLFHPLVFVPTPSTVDEQKLKEKQIAVAWWSEPGHSVACKQYTQAL